MTGKVGILLRNTCRNPR